MTLKKSPVNIPTTNPVVKTPIVRISGIPETPKPSKPKRKKGRIILLGLVVLCLGFGVALAKTKALLDPAFANKQKNLLGQVSDILQLPSHQLVGEKEGRVDILLLGIGGENHDGGYLSDSIILAQFFPKEKQTILISLPRDMITETPERLAGRKINSALSEGYLKNKNWQEALDLAKTAISSITGSPIHYATVVDFTGFEKIIDILGGVDIDIKNSFTDYTYPDGKGGFLAPVSFKQGLEKMDGKRALIYARSRHAPGTEGSDFARSKRQQQVIESAKNTFLKQGIFSPSKLTQILSTVSEHLHTDMNTEDILRLYSIGKSTETMSLSLTPETGLICPKIQEETGAYTLTSCPGKDISDIHNFFTNAKTTAQVGKEAPKILLAAQNAFDFKTQSIKLTLENFGAKVTQINYDSVIPEENFFYLINQKDYTAKFLEKEFSAKTVVLPPPDLKIDPNKTDIILVLSKSRKISP